MNRIVPCLLLFQLRKPPKYIGGKYINEKSKIKKFSCCMSIMLLIRFFRSARLSTLFLLFSLSFSMFYKKQKQTPNSTRVVWRTRIVTVNLLKTYTVTDLDETEIGYKGRYSEELFPLKKICGQP